MPLLSTSGLVYTSVAKRVHLTPSRPMRQAWTAFHQDPRRDHSSQSIPSQEFSPPFFLLGPAMEFSMEAGSKDKVLAHPPALDMYPPGPQTSFVRQPPCTCSVASFPSLTSGGHGRAICYDTPSGYCEQPRASCPSVNDLQCPSTWSPSGVQFAASVVSVYYYLGWCCYVL